MVTIEPYVGHDITPPTTGFYNIYTLSTIPYSIRSYPCGTNIFSTISTGTYTSIPYYIGSGECLQLYNPNNTTVNVDYSIGSNGPATTLLTASLVIWFLLLFFSYIVLLIIGYKGTRYIVNKLFSIPPKKSNDDNNHGKSTHAPIGENVPSYRPLPPLPDYNPTAPPYQHNV